MSQKRKSFIAPASKQAVASVALVSLLSAVEQYHNAKKAPGQEDFSKQDMSGELQTIPARHGVATFVPRGRTIKIINTYGKQVVSTWAFALHKPPEEEKEETQQNEEEKEGGVEAHAEEKEQAGKAKAKTQKKDLPKKTEKKVEAEVEKPKEEAENNVEDPPEQDLPQDAKKESEKEEKKTEDAGAKQPQKRTWSSYIPSMPYRNKGAPKKPDPETEQSEKAENEANSKKWSSYIPTGKSFSSYVPNVQLPDSKGVVSAFKASHFRDPNKSYAEQLYDFSKTPVGAGSIAAATGSGTASSIYAAYNAYTKLAPSLGSQPPMEYLSVAHTRAASHHLTPEPEDTLLSNLRNPIITLIEDTTPGAHDTLTAACDASLYAALGVDKPEEHGSCAENLVLALKELNEKAGLKGNKAVGADVTVNFAPVPLHLFMNAPVELGASAKEDGTGAKGASFKVDEPKGKKRSYVRFKAERDVVIVLSACPMDVGKQNGGKCMAANFIVEEAEEEDAKDKDKVKEVKGKPMPKPKGGPAKFANTPKPKQQEPVKKAEDKQNKADETPASESAGNEESPKPKKKPKKLERRSTPAS